MCRAPQDCLDQESELGNRLLHTVGDMAARKPGVHPKFFPRVSRLPAEFHQYLELEHPSIQPRWLQSTGLESDAIQHDPVRWNNSANRSGCFLCLSGPQVVKGIAALVFGEAYGRRRNGDFLCFPARIE